jgi:hypothetical protein
MIAWVSALAWKTKRSSLLLALSGVVLSGAIALGLVPFSHMLPCGALSGNIASSLVQWRSVASREIHMLALWRAMPWEITCVPCVAGLGAVVSHQVS